MFPSEIVHEEVPKIDLNKKKKESEKEKRPESAVSQTSMTIKPVGDYSRQEIAWYRAQMTEIDNFIEEKKEACYEVIVEYS